MICHLAIEAIRKFATFIVSSIDYSFDGAKVAFL